MLNVKTLLMVGMLNGAALMENCTSAPQKIKTKLPYDPDMKYRKEGVKVTKKVVWGMPLTFPYIFLPCDRYLKTCRIKDLPV